MGLQVWLPLNGNTKQQGMSGITMTGSPNSWVNGKIGQCAHFEGSTSSVIYNNTSDFNYTDDFSWAIWVKTNYTGSTTQYIFTNGRADAGGYGYGLRCISTTDCSCLFGNSSWTIPVTGGEWTHLTFTKNGTTIKIYKNGILYKTYTFHGTLPTYSDGNGLGLGCFHYSSNIYPFYGDLNDFRIYDHVLSPREVKEISKGLVLHYPLSMPGQENIIANTSHEIACTYPASGVKDYYSVKTKSVPNETQYTLSFEARSTVDGDHLRTHFYSPNTTTTCESSQGIIKTASDGNMDFTLTTEWRRYWVVYTQTETTAIKSVICPRLCSPASYPSSQSGTGTVYVRNQKLEHGSHPTPWIPNPTDPEYSAFGFDDGIEYDVSGYQYNGEKFGSLSYSSNTPRYNTCYEFDGLTAYVRLKHNLYSKLRLARDEVTVNIWAYKDDWDDYKNNGTGSQWMTMCGCQEGGGFSIYEIGNGRFSFVCGTGESSNSYKVSNTSTEYADSLSSGWHMFTLTFDGLSLKGYVDGNLVVSNAFFTTKTPIYYNTGTTSIYIGVESGSGKQAGLWWKGKLSDFRMYTTALSADDILELYHTPISLSNNGTLLTQGEYVES